MQPAAKDSWSESAHGIHHFGASWYATLTPPGYDLLEEDDWNSSTNRLGPYSTEAEAFRGLSYRLTAVLILTTRAARNGGQDIPF